MNSTKRKQTPGESENRKRVNCEESLSDEEDSFFDLRTHGKLFCIRDLIHSVDTRLYCKEDQLIEYTYVNDISKDRLFIAVKPSSKEIVELKGSFAYSKGTQGKIQFRSGNYWEGEVVNNMACGWGTMFSPSSKPLYQGFVYNTTYVCYGILYDENGNPCYEGTFLNGKRHGLGHSISDSISNNEDVTWIQDSMTFETTLSIPSKTEYNLPIYSIIQHFTMDTNSCHSFKYFKLEYCYDLKTVKIGHDCCRGAVEFALFDCPELIELDIGCASFVNVTSFLVGRDESMV